MRIGTGPRVGIAVASGPVDVTVNRSGTIAFVSCPTDSAIDFIDLADNRATSGLRPPASAPYRLALSPDEKRLYVTTFDDRRSALADGRPGARARGAPRRVAFSASGDRAFVANALGQVDVIR